MRKQLPTDAITNELAQSSVFFQRPPGDPSHAPVEKPLKAKPVKPHSPAPPVAKPQRATQPTHEASNLDGMTSSLTSQLQAIDLKQWQEIIEDTETQNSALRLTSEERYAIEDVVSELRRQYGIKTSMNEIARLGLLLLIHDFAQHKKASLIHAVKKA